MSTSQHRGRSAAAKQMTVSRTVSRPSTRPGCCPRGCEGWTGEDCAVEWETAEEISAAKSKLTNTVVYTVNNNNKRPGRGRGIIN